MSQHREELIALGTGKLHLLRGGQGRPLVYLHHSTGGLGWIPLFDKLAARFEVFAPDMPGYAGSERPEWAREPRDLAVILGHCLDRLGLSSAVLVGAGFGGFVAAELASMRPNNFSHLVLLGAAGLKPKHGEIADQMMMGHTAYMQLGFRDAAHFAKVFGDEPGEEVRQLWDYSREMTARVTWKPYMFSRRLAPLLKAVAAPTLLLWGEQDQVVPLDCAERYREALAQASLQVLAGAGHLVELEEPDEVARHIQSLVG